MIDVFPHCTCTKFYLSRTYTCVLLSKCLTLILLQCCLERMIWRKSTWIIIPSSNHLEPFGIGTHVLGSRSNDFTFAFKTRYNEMFPMNNPWFSTSTWPFSALRNQNMLSLIALDVSGTERQCFASVLQSRRTPCCPSDVSSMAPPLVEPGWGSWVKLAFLVNGKSS